jgi:hypothetical protein
MGLPLLVIPPGGINGVAALRLAPQLFAPFESAWAWGAKLAAANALSAFEVVALMGLPAGHPRSLLPPHVPRTVLTLGKSIGLPSWRVKQAFLGGDLECLHPLMSESLRRCPDCVRLGYHFILHQIRALGTCPLHHVPLREHCARCAAHLAYELGSSKVHGPIACPSCVAPLLPVTRGGYPSTGTITAGEFRLIAHWLAFVRRRAAQPAWLSGRVAVDTVQPVQDASKSASLHAIMPAGEVRRPGTRVHARWTDDAEYRDLEHRYWRDANARWRQCDERSRQWYRRLLKGAATQDTPSVRVLAYVYWRMTWQGCSNPYLLRRGHGLPLYGVAEWQAAQPAPDDDDLDAELDAFSAALEASWHEWLDCIDLLKVTTLEQRAWRLRANPSSYLPLPQRQRKRTTGNFA